MTKSKITKGTCCKKDKKDEFMIKNAKHIFVSYSIPNLLSNRTIKRIFKKKSVVLTKKEVDKLLYDVIKDHPEGLTKDQISYFSGISMSKV